MSDGCHGRAAGDVSTATAPRSPITASAIPEGRASGAGLSATMASTTAETWTPAPTLDEMNIVRSMVANRW